MGLPTIATAQCMCSFGTNPSNLMVLPNNKVMVENKPAANIMDNKPMVNIMPFGYCFSPYNPQYTCVPVTNAPWVPGSPTVMLGTAPILNNSSKLMCNWGGIIQILNPGATKETVP